MNAARWLVNRLHVSTSERAVVRFLRSKIAQPDRTNPEKKRERKKFYRAGLTAHRENRELYISVTKGQI